MKHRWLDPSIPLPEGVRYLRRVVEPNLPLAIVLAVPFVLGITLAVTDLAFGRWRSENGWLLAVMAGPFIILMEMQRRDRRLERELVAGTRRLGLFLSNDELLWAMELRDALLLPRAQVVGPKTRNYYTGRTQTLGVELFFLDGKGRHRSRCVLPQELAGFGRNQPELLALLQKWKG